MKEKEKEALGEKGKKEWRLVDQLEKEVLEEKEDLEAVTDAPISVSGGAPTAENSI